MADPIERRGDYGVEHPRWTRDLTGEDRPTISTISIVRGRGRWGLHSVVAFATTILVFAGLARSFPESNGEVLIRAFSDTPRTQVTTSGIMSSQRLDFLRYSPADCAKVPTKSGKRLCWNQERFSKP